MILLGGYLIFGSDPGFVSICGAFMALCGMSVYASSSNLKESRESLSKQLPKQNLPSPRPKTNTEESPELDTKDATNVV